MKRVQSSITESAWDIEMENMEPQTDVRDFLVDPKTGLTSLGQYDPILIQLPGTLPFAEVKPHQSSTLNDLLDRIVRKQTTTNSDSSERDLDEKSELPKIGKLVVMKSGKVCLRIQLDSDKNEFVDLEVNKGIESSFY